MADLSWLTSRPIAHRGLHDREAGRPENSLAAFRSAVDHQYAIECDLQFSSDGVPMVFHDEELGRLTAHSGTLGERTADILSSIALCGTDQTIPRLQDLLSLVAGSVPVILELKDNGTRNAAFAAAVSQMVKAYEGPVAVMSFDRTILSEFRDVAHGLPRGLVAEGSWRTAITHLLAVFRLDLHFVSYNVADLPTVAPWIARRILGLPLICWTVRTHTDRLKSARWAEQMTFEGFLP